MDSAGSAGPDGSVPGPALGPVADSAEFSFDFPASVSPITCAEALGYGAADGVCEPGRHHPATGSVTGSAYFSVDFPAFGCPQDCLLKDREPYHFPHHLRGGTGVRGCGTTTSGGGALKSGGGGLGDGAGGLGGSFF
ncbi:MAG: hypothetical protein MPL62_13630 [Alphaproteobacteria bacterium]|nr:hypothetical protein [Alphaproteobacteria bacterium]